jgi:hypothetical protein
MDARLALKVWGSSLLFKEGVQTGKMTQKRSTSEDLIELIELNVQVDLLPEDNIETLKKMNTVQLNAIANLLRALK